MIYVIEGQSTGCNGNIIHWADSAYTKKEVACAICDKMNRSNQNDPNYLAYVTGVIPLDEMEGLA